MILGFLNIHVMAYDSLNTFATSIFEFLDFFQASI